MLEVKRRGLGILDPSEAPPPRIQSTRFVFAPSCQKRYSITVEILKTVLRLQIMLSAPQLEVLIASVQMYFA